MDATIPMNQTINNMLIAKYLANFREIINFKLYCLYTYLLPSAFYPIWGMKLRPNPAIETTQLG